MSESPIAATSPATPAFQKLVAKLREVFQIDQPDLDFGIYRIINARAAEIGDYLENKLRAKVDASLATGQQAGLADLQRDLATAEQQLRDLGVDPDGSPKVKELRARVAALSGGATEHRDAVFSHLLTFFSRYYDRGDFISQRRYKGDTYAIPYSGEEVVLHWANKDQYYTKSGENFSNYTFTLADGRRVHFRLASADTAKDDRKETDLERRFRLIAPRTVTRTGDDDEEVQEQQVPIVEVAAVPAADGRPATPAELILWFEYVPLPKKGDSQDVLNTRARDTVLADAAVKSRWLDLAQRKPTEKNPQRTLLDKQLEDYTQKNKSDYFIHKDLGGFLRRELDFYIKNEVMHLDDVQNAASFVDIEKSLRMIQCLRAIALDLIAFLAQLEDFQKKLWLKKKFVVEAHYCLTLDRIYKLGEDLDAKDTTRPGVLAERDWLLAQIATNEEQIAAWIDLGLVKDRDCEPVVVSADPLFSQAKTVAERLRANPFLMVDTQWFSNEFKYRLLAQLHDLDAQCDGLLVHSDNQQALRLLQERHQNQVDCVLIDPPYNTGGDGFCYKDGFKSSTWLSHQDQTIGIARDILTRSGSLFAFCDENEIRHFMPMLEQAFGSKNVIETIIWNKRIPKNDKGIGNIHDYIMLLAKDKEHRKAAKLEYVMRKDELEDIYELIRRCKSDGLPLQQTQEELKKFYNKQGYDRGITLYCELDLNYEIWGKINMSWPNAKTEGPRYKVINPVTKTACPVPDRGWRWKEDTFRDAEKNGSTYTLPDGSMVVGRIWYSTKPTVQPSSITYLKEVETFLLRSILSVKSDGSVSLENLGLGGIFDYPKSVTLTERVLFSATQSDALIFDYFGGSGTTAHATINLNRKEKGSRRYLLVEQGAYFDSVLTKRVQKVIYSADWQSSKPLDYKSGTSHTYKYLRLESYEDTLNNLALKRPDGLTDLFDPAGKEDYLLHYMLNVESQASLLSVADFKKPFDYKLRIATDSAGACQTRSVDLVETFNYLLGLRVAHLDAKLAVGYVLVSGKLPDGQSCLIVWRDCEKLDYEATSRLLERHKITPNDNEFDVVYINGDHNIPTIAQATEAEGGVTRQLTLRQIEPEFLSRMFAGEEL